MPGYYFNCLACGQRHNLTLKEEKDAAYMKHLAINGYCPDCYKEATTEEKKTDATN